MIPHSKYSDLEKYLKPIIMWIMILRLFFYYTLPWIFTLFKPLSCINFGGLRELCNFTKVIHSLWMWISTPLCISLIYNEAAGPPIPFPTISLLILFYTENSHMPHKILNIERKCFKFGQVLNVHWHLPTVSTFLQFFSRCMSLILGKAALMTKTLVICTTFVWFHSSTSNLMSKSVATEFTFISLVSSMNFLKFNKGGSC